jgi:hypothetical protein
MRPQKNRGGTGNKLNIASFIVSNVLKSQYAYGYMILDVSKINTLIIGSVTTRNNPNFNGGYVRVREQGGGAVIANLSVTNNQQTVNLSSYNIVELAVYFIGSGSDYANVSVNDITGE